MAEPLLTGGCGNSCNCYVSEDGYYANRPQDGRRNTARSGSGTVNDPYTIHFIDSEFYRVPAAELRKTNVSVQHDTYTDVFWDYTDLPPATIVYESPPGSVMINFPVFPHIMTAGQFFYGGVSTRFATHSTGTRLVEIRTASPDGGSTEYYVGKQIIDAVDIVNTHNTFMFFGNSLYDQTFVNPQFSGLRLNAFGVQVYQNSGITLDLLEVRFWVGVL